MKKPKGKIFILSGPSGSGKTTLYRKLLKSPRLRHRIVKTVSTTTRDPRPGEIHGKDYSFISAKHFEYKKRAGHFLECQKVFDNYYGTPKKAVDAALRDGKNVLLCIDVQGARVIREKFSEAVPIFIKTKTIGQLKERLLKRGSEDSQRLNLRLETAKKELEERKYYKHTVINDQLPHALRELEKIILSEISL